MKAIIVFLAAGFFTFASPAVAEACRAAWTGADGEPETRAIAVDFVSRARLDPALLPPGTSAIVCRRPSLVPLANDVRVLIEWRVAFAVSGDGPRMLWISARDGRLQITVDHGELNVAEAAAVDDWLKMAQARFAASLGGR